MGAWSMVSVAMNVMGCLLNATGHVRSQSFYGALAALVNLWLSIAWAPTFGLTGVIAATVVAYIFCNTLPVCWQVKMVLQYH
jgi:O-antigen/teichoic acid export membrane protein